MPMISRRARALTGEAPVPGDKSISHRALILGAVAVGETPIRGLLEAGDVLCTANAVRLLGAGVDRDGLPESQAGRAGHAAGSREEASGVGGAGGVRGRAGASRWGRRLHPGWHPANFVQR